MQELQIKSKKEANHHTCKTLLNCYLRECGGYGVFSVNHKNNHYQIDFPAKHVQVVGQLAYYSAIGEHEYANYFIAGKQADFMDILTLIIREFRMKNPAISQDQNLTFMRKVSDSCHKLSLFIQEANPLSVTDYISSEQSLIYGHPFHPFPKNREGFHEKEIYQYSPECRSVFQLGYVAVRTDCFLEDWLCEDKISWGDDVEQQARRKLGSRYQGYRILPMHPWQYQYVQTLEPISRYKDREALVFLGILGHQAFPTSSVRTVYLPELQCNLKLPLNLQITNMKRNNTAVQMQRTLEASRYLRDSQCFYTEPNTQISGETGAMSCAFDDEHLSELFTLAYRPVNFDLSSTLVVASLVEKDPFSHLPRLQHIVDTHRLEEWLYQYLDISLLPLMREANSKGIHFEAHLQNSLVTLRKDGMPQQFIVRDLEGVSVEGEYLQDEKGSDSSLFYRKEQARQRTCYYFLINHLGTLIHTIARILEVQEANVWKVVDNVLAQEAWHTGNAFIKEVRSAKVFLAKKNMSSCFFENGEDPEYVFVPNILNQKQEGEEC
ncbi:hypothetical protein EPH95_16125 [Salicibibacter halophilus]|uniref:IucA/IucC family siderophore biosynthesis protein n=1 Tax=Salicibibacter halophilus TaxID=2502791 RepID=A0A514LKZ3_9BACI|nr:IucA/IucC family protein [Salicibibacter halophilus]QDI92527.1 hypothetical protein EPH95_16125 [Salicibibacter halophilus]